MECLTPQQADTKQVIASAHLFTVRRFEGRGHYLKAEAATLREAAAIAKQWGRGPYGHRPMIYAVNRAGRCVHVDEGEYPRMNEYGRFHVCDFRDPQNVKIGDFATKADAVANCPSEGGAAVISSETDLQVLNVDALIAIYNHLRRGPPVKTFENSGVAAARIWVLLQAPRDRAQDSPLLATKEVPMVGKRKAKKSTSKPPTAKKSAATAQANGHDAFGLRSGSAVSEAARMFARDGGATMAEVKEKTGTNQYNLLKKLKAEGHKLKSEKGRFYLSAK